jgi:hypothetical protein
MIEGFAVRCAHFGYGLFRLVQLSPGKDKFRIG